MNIYDEHNAYYYEDNPFKRTPKPGYRDYRYFMHYAEGFPRAVSACRSPARSFSKSPNRNKQELRVRGVGTLPGSIVKCGPQDPLTTSALPGFSIRLGEIS